MSWWSRYLGLSFSPQNPLVTTTTHTATSPSSSSGSSCSRPSCSSGGASFASTSSGSTPRAGLPTHLPSKSTPTPPPRTSVCRGVVGGWREGDKGFLMHRSIDCLTARPPSASGCGWSGAEMMTACVCFGTCVCVCSSEEGDEHKNKDETNISFLLLGGRWGQTVHGVG